MEVGVRIPILVALFLAVVALPILASSKKSTDAKADGFNGAVKSVSTERQVISRSWPRQPDGPSVIYPAGCEVCEYDEDGRVVLRGQNWEAGFVGERTQYVRDENGNINQQIVENEKGQLVRNVIVGPQGKTQEKFYLRGVLQSTNRYSYDPDGNIVEWLTYDAHGVQTARTTATFDEHGTVTEQFDYGPKNKFLLHFTQSYDPETDVQTFTNYNDDGTVRLTFTAKEERVVSYWQQPSDKHELGSTVCFKTGCESHNLNGSPFRTVTMLKDGDTRNPRRIELRDDRDQPQMTANYEYEFDGHGNWTKRSVWVCTRESGERQLVEIDSRTLNYWK
jgi:hypothetical protein